MGCVYFIRAVTLKLIKIGLAVDPADRLCELQVGSPDRLILLGVIESESPAELERDLHRRFAADRQHGEWFKPSAALMGLIDAEADVPGKDEQDRAYRRALAMTQGRDARIRLHHSERRRRTILDATGL